MSDIPTNDGNLEIVNGWLVERGAHPADYPAGAAYGALPYSDAEPLLHLSELPGWPKPLSLDDATVERIADVVFPKATTPILFGFKQTHDEAWVLARDEHHATIRAVLAAAVEAGQ